MRKVLSWILAMVLLVNCMVTFAIAAENPAFSADQITACAGETVSVNVSTSSITYQDYGMYVHYDSNVLTLISVSEGTANNGTFGYTNNNPGTIKAAVYGGSNKTTSGALFTMTFEIEDGVTPGTYPIELEVISVRNEAQDFLTVDMSDGSITIVASECNHQYSSIVTHPTCTEQGYTTYTCAACGDSYVADYMEALGHDWVGSVCTRCGQVQGEYFVDVELSDPETVASAWVDGKESDFSVIADGIRVYLEDAKATNLVIYTYNDPNAVDLHTQYPIGMRVWLLAFDNGVYTATYVPEFDNLLQYSGSSIRIVGVKGIRMITSISKAKRYALMTGGLAGYTLEEYGTCLAWASEVDSNNPLVLGKEYTKSNYAYKKDVADPIFLDTGDLIQYTNVLVGFTDDQCIPDIVMRPYIVLKNADGQELTIYGGQVCRSIGYIAWQNRNIFPAGSAEYAYVWNIIHHVYGDQYDAEYKG